MSCVFHMDSRTICHPYHPPHYCFTKFSVCIHSCCVNFSCHTHCTQCCHTHCTQCWHTQACSLTDSFKPSLVSCMISRCHRFSYWYKSSLLLIIPLMCSFCLQPYYMRYETIRTYVILYLCTWSNRCDSFIMKKLSSSRDDICMKDCMWSHCLFSWDKQ